VRTGLDGRHAFAPAAVEAVLEEKRLNGQIGGVWSSREGLRSIGPKLFITAERRGRTKTVWTA
jgi:hypothetical protein